MDPVEEQWSLTTKLARLSLCFPQVPQEEQWSHLHSLICRRALPSSLFFRHSSMDWMAASVEVKVGSDHAPSMYSGSVAMAAVASFRFLFRSVSSLDMFSSCFKQM